MSVNISSAAHRQALQRVMGLLWCYWYCVQLRDESSFAPSRSRSIEFASLTDGTMQLTESVATDTASLPGSRSSLELTLKLTKSLLWSRFVGSAGNTLWQGGNADAEARWLNWTLGNGLTTSTAFGTNTGRLSSLTTSGGVQGLSLTYDGFGNIKSRLDAANGYKQGSGAAETFTYDTLNQLTQANFLEGTQNITYDGLGRILTKTGVNAVAGTYTYYALTTNGSTTSNRVQSANNRGYTFDANGNVDTITGTAVGSITLSWTSFNQSMTLPVAAAQNTSASATGNAGGAITLKYGADNARVMEQLPIDVSVSGANQTATRFVLHSGANLFYEEDVKADGSSEARAYLTGPLGVVAVHTTAVNNTGTGTPTLTYWHRDHLGSLTVTTNELGVVKDRMRFDPWGKPMTPLGARNGSGDRGFTGHEHLAGGLIHMNGRIYDPVLGRFFSADIVVQAPSAITSYNRYAYVMNNPLAYTDPSGYFIEEIVIAVMMMAEASPLLFAASVAATAGEIAYVTGHRTAARRFFAAAIMFATAGTPYAAIGAFAAGGVQSGSLEGAVLAGISSGLFAAAGEISTLAEHAAMGEYMSSGAMGPPPPNPFSVGGIGRAGMHFGAGAVRAMIAGGDPVRGGFSAGFAEIAGPYVSGTDIGIKQFAAHVVAGGIGEVIAGGKFANGAMTGAFAWLYNHATAAQKARATHRVELTAGGGSGGIYKDRLDVYSLNSGELVASYDVNVDPKDNKDYYPCPKCGRLAPGSYDLVRREGASWYPGKPLLYVNDGEMVPSTRENLNTNEAHRGTKQMNGITIHGSDSNSIGCLRVGIQGLEWQNFMNQYFPKNSSTRLTLKHDRIEMCRYLKF